MIKNLLQHKIRKDILANNKKINHKSFLKSMGLTAKIPYLMSYHKKKLIFAVVIGLISWTYSLHKSIYYWLLGLRAPHKIIIGLFVDIQKPQSTVLEQSTHKVTLKPQTQDLLMKIYYEGDKNLYFGIGRNYLFQVYKQLGLLEKPDQERSFWLKSGFHKKRNQLASGVDLVQFLQVFQEGLNKLRQNNKNLSEQEFLDNFMKVFMSKCESILEWQKQFNFERQTQFLKNAPGLSQKKQELILSILKENPQISLQALQKDLQRMGLRGASLSNKFLYYRTREVWQSLKQYHLLKKIYHPTINEFQKRVLQKQKQKMDQILDQIRTKKNKTLQEFNILYEQQLL